MSDYERIAKIIRFLDQHHECQPNLAKVAELVGLSPFHVHRLFKQWAGVTPKAFVQYLTLERSKRALQRGQSVFDVAIDAGLSGSGRLHDLCVKLEAATPGEIKSGGEGLQIHWGVGETPFGSCVLARTTRGLCHLAFAEREDARASIETLHEDWPKAIFERDNEKVQDQLGDVFRCGYCPSITAWVRGTDFQLRVWRALLAIPAGCLTSYGRLAEAIGMPKAARAVGSAVGANPLAFLIPCHRVIRETGVIGNYRWGHGRKRILIAWENALTFDQLSPGDG